MLEMVGDWGEFVTEDVAQQEADALREHEPTGRPGDDGFITGFERLLGRDINLSWMSRYFRKERTVP